MPPEALTVALWPTHMEPEELAVIVGLGITVNCNVFVLLQWGALEPVTV